MYARSCEQVQEAARREHKSKEKESKQQAISKENDIKQALEQGEGKQASIRVRRRKASKQAFEQGEGKQAASSKHRARGGGKQAFKQGVEKQAFEQVAP
jgi:phage-related minor tail protein